MPISDATLMHAFTGSNRRYLVVWDNGETAYLRAANLRQAKALAREFTRRLKDGQTLIAVRREAAE